MRFIHLADVHLGAVPDIGMPWSRKREEEIWSTFRRVFAAIRTDPVDLVLIAGDLFHRQPLMSELKEINSLFQEIPNTTVVLMAGEHDYLREDSAYLRMEWAENVIFLGENRCTCVELPKLNTYVYGLSYDKEEITEFLYHAERPVNKPGFHVILAHGGDAQHIPLKPEVVAGAGFDYIAMGHVHKPQILAGGRAVYAGTLEPMDSEDIGAHGYVLGEWKDNRLQVTMVPFAVRSYIHQTITVRDDATQASLEEELRAVMKEKGKENIYKVWFRGYRSPELMLLPERFQSLGNIVQIIDETRPAYDLIQLQKRYAGTLIGEYIQYFLERKRSPEEEKALYYGLQALLETRA